MKEDGVGDGSCHGDAPARSTAGEGRAAGLRRRLWARSRPRSTRGLRAHANGYHTLRITATSYPSRCDRPGWSGRSLRNAPWPTPKKKSGGERRPTIVRQREREYVGRYEQRVVRTEVLDRHDAHERLRRPKCYLRVRACACERVCARACLSVLARARAHMRAGAGYAPRTRRRAPRQRWRWRSGTGPPQQA
jgi:hypothetical protein